MERIYDVIIIGGGPAGYTAALYASRAGLDTLVIEKMGPGGQMALTDIIDNYPGFEEGIDGISLGMKMQAGAERFGAVTEYAEVTSLELSGKIKTIETAGGKFFDENAHNRHGRRPEKARDRGRGCARRQRTALLRALRRQILQGQDRNGGRRRQQRGIRRALSLASLREGHSRAST